MNIIVVGNGLAGTMAAKTLRELDSGVQIDIFGEEKYPYYPRPNLIGYLAGQLPYERLFAFSEEWHVRQKISIHLGRSVKKISPDSMEVEVGNGEKKKFDFLLLASGASSFVPPIKGAEKKGVFTLRTLDDAQAILGHLENHHQAAIIGGGLLGLEIARAIKMRGAEVEVVEFFDRLLPRQLDAQGAALLKRQIERMGIKVRLGVATEEIIGRGEVGGLKFKNGEETPTEMAVIAAGVRPNLELAKEAGLAVDRGVVVDDFLKTSHPKIFAAGDNIQHQGKIWGIIPASFDQARIAASNILGQERKYQGTIPSNTLKVVGLDVTSIGLVNPEEKGGEEYRKTEEDKGIYKKIVLQNGALVGAIWMGTRTGVNEVTVAVNRRRKVEEWKERLLEDEFDFSLLQ